MVRDPIEREGQNELSSSRGPAEGGLRIAHSFARADNPPQDIGKARTGGRDGVLETAFCIDLAAGEVG